MKSTGGILFWAGFIAVILTVAAFLLILLFNAPLFTTWIASLSFCGLVLVGTAMMMVGRSLEKNSRNNY